MKEIGFMFVGLLTFVLLENNRWYLESSVYGRIALIRKPVALFKRWNLEHVETVNLVAIKG